MGVVASMRAPNHMVLPDIGFDIIDIVPRWPNGPAWLPSIFTVRNATKNTERKK